MILQWTWFVNSAVQHQTTVQCWFNIGQALARWANIEPTRKERLICLWITKTRGQKSIHQSTVIQFIICWVRYNTGPPGDLKNSLPINHHSYVICWSVPISQSLVIFNPFPTKLYYLVFYHALEVVSRYSDKQLQTCASYSYLFILRPNICKSWKCNQTCIT